MTSLTREVLAKSSTLLSGIAFSFLKNSFISCLVGSVPSAFVELLVGLLAKPAILPVVRNVDFFKTEIKMFDSSIETTLSQHQQLRNGSFIDGYFL